MATREQCLCAFQGIPFTCLGKDGLTHWRADLNLSLKPSKWSWLANIEIGEIASNSASILFAPK